MDLVVYEVVQFEEVHIAYGHLLVERFPRPPVIENRLPSGRKSGSLQEILDLFLRSSVEHRDRDENSFTQLPGQLDNLVIGRLLQVFIHLF